MLNVIQAPSKYIQGENALDNMGHHINTLGDNFFIIASPSGMKRVKSKVEKSLQPQGIKSVFAEFNGECSHQEINRLIAEMKKNSCKAVIGIGGGKILDAAKAIAYYQKTPVVIVPTIASTDAPTSALSVIYKEDGAFDEYLLLPTNPDLVLMDSAIIAKAPVRLLVAGMGDALATYFEAQACYASNAISMAGGQSTLAALAMAKLCYETLLEEGLKAKLAVEVGVVTEAVERIIEANTYLSGIGFESSGLAAAHAIHNGLTVLSDGHDCYHGEKVAFGTLCQLVLQNSSTEEMNEVMQFCCEVGLPITLRQLGICDDLETKIMQVAKASCAEGETIHNMPFNVTPEKVYATIRAADKIGENWLAQY